ncbi:hypothetical protein HJD18_03370 [Thermoleophilia bacterium SCSIO 60948]|nr:hypothetical protein HJD18_03370 [Thermoleophilia bacterium SCSIO 60948]
MDIPEPVEFFVPNTDPEQCEARWQELREAVQSGRNQQLGDERIYSISFESNRGLCTATVGSSIRVRTPRKRGGYDTNYGTSTILAIFSGPSYLIVQEPGPNEWHNPAMAGVPTLVVYFVGLGDWTGYGPPTA